ncbi:MAG TPA: Wzz/FepE/Etk N-terminal domain-containing protein [Gemmatimonadaceae bacterium]|nr:Wzz/FepE/Etk N-terminal domain-containing protein [Gemmatimonadaceae bacterium]
MTAANLPPSSPSGAAGGTPAVPAVSDTVYTPGPQSLYVAESDESLRALGRRMLRRRWLLGGIVATTFAAVAVWTFTRTPRYRSEARLRIESETAAGIADGLAGGAVAPVAGSLLGSFTNDELSTEIAILQSDRISDATIDSLALAVRVLDPAASRARVLAARILDPSIDIDGQLTLQRQADGAYRPEWNAYDGSRPVLPARLAPGSSVRIGGALLTLSPTLHGAGPAKIVVRILPRYQVHKLLDKRLSIARQEGGSRLVEISYEDPDRVLAAQVVSTLIHEYVTYSTGMARTEDTTTVAVLQGQVDSTGRRLAIAEQSLRGFEEQSRLVAPEEQASAQIKRISALSAHVDEISTERNALARMLAIIDQRSKGGSDAAAYRQLATFPSLITNRAIQDLLQSLVDLENKRSQLGVRRTANNDEYRQLTDRITQIEQQLYSVGPQYLESLDQELRTTAQTVAGLTDTLRTMPAEAMQYGRLLRDRTILETTYIALQKQLKQAQLRDVLRQNRVKIVDAPRIANAEDPAYPKKPVMLLVGAVLAIVLALTVGLFVDLWQGPKPAI